MNGGARVHPRPYGFEVVVCVHMIVLWPFLTAHGFDFQATFFSEFLRSGVAILLQILAGVVVRFGWEAFRGRGRAFLRAISSPGWVSDSLRIIVAGVFSVLAYSWIKLLVPVFHARLFDAELWELDRMLFGGYSPNIVFLNLFSAPNVLQFFDGAYARIFFFSLAGAGAFFFSHPSRRVRVAFNTGSVWLWISGAWLYFLIPSLGPAYAFADVWMPFGRDLPITRHFQLLLIRNYQNVLQLRNGINAPVTFMFGVAAFPSLHVAFQTFVFLWMRRIWIYGQVIFGTFVVLIFLGSMITGWHYFIDGIAGMALAGFWYWAGASRFGIFRWIRLRETLARR